MDTAKHWNDVYATRAPQDVSWYQFEPTLSLKLIESCPLGANAAVIDIGAGSSLLVDHLLQRGYRDVTLLDISQNALQRVKTRLGPAAAQVQWVVRSVTDFEPQRRYNVWHDRAVLHFLTDAADQEKYVAALRRSLISNGFAVIATFAIGGPKQCSGLDIVQYDAAKMSTLLGADFELVDTVTEVHKTPASKDQLYAYFKLRRR